VSTPALLEAASVQVWPADTIVWAMLCGSEAGYMVPQSGPVRRQSYWIRRGHAVAARVSRRT